MKKSFTLIEILVATAIFMIVVVIAMASLTMITNSKKKTTSNKNVQEMARLSMETIANEIKDSNSVKGTVGSNIYYNFYIADSSWNPAPIVSNLNQGSNLVTIQNPNASEKKFSLDTADPTHGFIKMEVNGNVAELSSPNINVTALQFRGVHQVGPSANDPPTLTQQPFVSILITASGRWNSNSNESVTATIETTVSPLAISVPKGLLIYPATPVYEAGYCSGSTFTNETCPSGSVAVGAGHYSNNDDWQKPELLCAQLNGPGLDRSHPVPWTGAGYVDFRVQMSGNLVEFVSGHVPGPDPSVDNEWPTATWAPLLGATIDYSDVHYYWSRGENDSGCGGQSPANSYVLPCPVNHVLIGEGHWAGGASSPQVDNELTEIACAKIKSSDWSLQWNQ